MRWHGVGRLLALEEQPVPRPREREVLLREEGDFVLWEPGVPHRWQAEGPTIVVTVRWPSLPGDSRDVGRRGVRVMGCWVIGGWL